MHIRRQLIPLASIAIALTLAACGNNDNNDGETGPITLSCDHFSANATLPDHQDGEAVDYIVPKNCVLKADQEVTIEPGVIVEFEQGAGISVGENGALKAAGTAAKPIVLRGAVATTGSWKGLIFDSDNLNNVLEHVELRHGGGDQFNSNGDKANIIVWADANLTVKNSTIAESGSYGLTSYNGATLTFAQNTFQKNTLHPVDIYASQAHAMDSASTFTENGTDRIRVKSAAVEGEVTWSALSVPYEMSADSGVTDITDGGLTIEAGTTLAFGSNGGLQIGEKAYLSAIGTAEKPIVFTGVDEVKGSWRGIMIGSNHVKNVLEYIELAYAGSDAFNSNGDKGGIIMWAETRLTIKNSTIRDLDTECGINATYHDETLESTDNTFTNVTTDICQDT